MKKGSCAWHGLLGPRRSIDSLKTYGTPLKCTPVSSSCHLLLLQYILLALSLFFVKSTSSLRLDIKNPTNLIRSIKVPKRVLDLLVKIFAISKTRTQDT